MNAPRRPMADWAAAIARDNPEVVDIAGGEPLLVGWIPELLRACPATWFGLSTNGLISPEILRLCEAKPQNLTSINVSFHPDAIERWPQYMNQWRWAVTTLRVAGFYVHCNVVNYADNVAAAEGVRAFLERLRVPLDISPYEEVAGLGERRGLGLVCQGGVNHLTVGPDGTAWPCLTALRSPYWKEMILGNWLDNTIGLARKPQPCYLDCVDYYILPNQHIAGDMWQIEARPWGETG